MLEFERNIDADVLELAFLATPPGDYLSASMVDRPEWRKSPHYFSVYRASDTGDKNLFEVGSDIGTHIADNAKVTISSSDGFISASATWPAAPPIVPAKRSKLLKFGSAAAVIALLLLGYGIYQINETEKSQQLIAEKQRQQQATQQKLTLDMANPNVGQSILEADLSACGNACPETLQTQAHKRIDDIKQKAQAEQDQRERQAAAEQKLTKDLAATDITQQTLEADLAACSNACPEALKVQAQKRIELLTQAQKKRIYKSSLKESEHSSGKYSQISVLIKHQLSRLLPLVTRIARLNSRLRPNLVSKKLSRDLQAPRRIWVKIGSRGLTAGCLLYPW